MKWDSSTISGSILLTRLQNKVTHLAEFFPGLGYDGFPQQFLRIIFAFLLHDYSPSHFD